MFLISDTQKRVPRFIYKELLKGTHKTVARILELEGQHEHREREQRRFLLVYTKYQ
jgi:hypothetical protein